MTYVDDEVAKKFKWLADQDDRTVSSYMRRLIEKTINDYEKENGKIEY